VTYTAQWYTYWKTIREGEDLPEFLTWNDSNRRFEIYSTDIEDVTTKRLTYKIQLKGSISKEQQPSGFEGTLSFNLIVTNDCLTDKITTHSVISDYIYYLNEDTYAPDFVKGLAIPQDKQWSVNFDQSVKGCPVSYSIYVTGSSGVRTIIDDFETPVISFLSTEKIDPSKPWLEQSVALEHLDAVVRV
jgi:hypothetical protein